MYIHNAIYCEIEKINNIALLIIMSHYWNVLEQVTDPIPYELVRIIEGYLPDYDEYEDLLSEVLNLNKKWINEAMVMNFMNIVENFFENLEINDKDRKLWKKVDKLVDQFEEHFLLHEPTMNCTTDDTYSILCSYVKEKLST